MASAAFYRCWLGREIVSDNLILDLLGLALVALCLIGLVPARRPPGRCVGDF
jgi:hypothetical protein